MSDQPIGHPSRGAERAMFKAALEHGGGVSTDGRYLHAIRPHLDAEGSWPIYTSVAIVSPTAPREPDGATLTERLLMRLVADQEVYWRNRDRRDRVRRQRRGGASGEGE